MYDFNDSGRLNVDELFLAFRSVTSGLSKLCSFRSPKDSEIEHILMSIYDNLKLNEDIHKNGLEKQLIIEYCLSVPEVLDWFEYFCDGNPSKNLFDDDKYETFGNAENINIEKIKWLDTIDSMNSTFSTSKKLIPLSNMRIQLQWAYGYNSSIPRNLYYSCNGDIIYAAGSLCIVQCVHDHLQSHFIGHTDNISCIDVFYTKSSRTIVATGDIGRSCRIHIWDSSSKEILSTLRGYCRHGIYCLRFSPDRKKLLTIGGDSAHTLVLFSWASQEVLFTSLLSRFKCFDMCFVSNNHFFVCGNNFVGFWKEESNSFRFNRGVLGNVYNDKCFYCSVLFDDNMVTTSGSGAIHIWDGANITKSFQGHNSAIQACQVHESTRQLVTACRNGLIKLWNTNFEPVSILKASVFGVSNSTISSICLNVSSSRILLAFESSEVIEIDSLDGKKTHEKLLVCGHFCSSVWACATHPFMPNIFASISDDKSLRLYNADLFSQLSIVYLKGQPRCICFSPDAQSLLIGFGQDTENSTYEGSYTLVKGEALSIIHESRISHGAITSCCYSPNGSYFILSSLDKCIYVINATKFVITAKCIGHSTSVISVDVSSDSCFLQSNDVSGELLFWDLFSGELQSHLLMADVEWNSLSCVFSMFSRYICDISDVVAATRSNDSRTLAVFYKNGVIKLYKLPCHSSSINTVIECHGHGELGRGISFSCDNKYLVSTGGTDALVIQWKVEIESLLDEIENKEINHETFPHNINRNILPTSNTPHVMKPWQKLIVSPSKIPIEDNDEPACFLEMDFVYGCATDYDKSLMYSPSGEIIYFISSIAIIMNHNTKVQRYYKKHKAIISSLDVNITQSLVATGDSDTIPMIRIWDPLNLKTVSVITGFHKQKILHLKFSEASNLLVSVGSDIFHSIAVYDWKTGYLICHCNSFTNNSRFISFLPTNNTIIHGGDQTLFFYDFNGLNMMAHKLKMEVQFWSQQFRAIGFLGQQIIVGTDSGNLLRFVERNFDLIIVAHSNAINCISCTSSEVCTASDDGFIKIWNSSLECKSVFDIVKFNCKSKSIIYLCWYEIANKILFGTKSCEVFEISSLDGSSLHKHPILEGHGATELYGISCHPIKHVFVTVGDDGMLLEWDKDVHACISQTQLEMPSRCCAFSPDGEFLAIGFGSPNITSDRRFDGKWIILSFKDKTVQHEARDSFKWINEIKFSPNGEYIAMTSLDYKLYIYNVSSGYSLIAAVSFHKAPILAIDFSTDSCWIRSNCDNFELAYFESDTGIHVPAASRMRDTNWATQNCFMEYLVQGIWQAKDDSKIISCDVNLSSGNNAVIVSGDSFGRINVHRFPCLNSISLSKTYFVSSNPISKLYFLCGDSNLVTVIGKDKCVIQWKLKKIQSSKRLISMSPAYRGVQYIPINQMSSSFSFPKEKPWIANLVVPISALKSPNEIAEDHQFAAVHTKCQYIFGSNTQLNNSAHFVDSMRIIYPISTVVVIMQIISGDQYFYDLHKYDISYVNISADRQLAVSVDTSNTFIHVWDIGSAQNLFCLSTYSTSGGIKYIEFSHDRRYIMSLAQDIDNTITLYESVSCNWIDAILLVKVRSSLSPLYCFKLYLNYEFTFAVTIGESNIKFWKLQGRSLISNPPKLDSDLNVGSLLCISILNSTILTGSSNGNVYVWNDAALLQYFKAHDTELLCIWSRDNHAFVVTASSSGEVKLWNSKFENLKTFCLSSKTGISCSIKSIDCLFSTLNKKINRILCTTSNGDMILIYTETDIITGINESNFDGELCGLSVNPVNADLFVTSCDDKTIRIYSIKLRRMLRKAVIDSSIRCIAWSLDGSKIIAGLGGNADGKRQRKDGTFVVLDATNLHPIYENR